jgi:hypothetical protein
MARRAALSVILLAIAATPAAAAYALPHTPEVPPSCTTLPGVHGSDRAQTITGSRRAEAIYGLGGRDTIRARAGNDCLFGGAGTSRLFGGAGNDVVAGAVGADGARAAYADRIDGGAGDDVLDGWDGDDTIRGGEGNDRIEGWSGRDKISGGAGDDAIGGGSGRNVISGGPGDDRIASANGIAETVDCGPGRDLVRADRSDRLHACERIKRVARSPWPIVLPATGGPRTTFKVAYRPPLWGPDRIEIAKRCGATGGIPWLQSSRLTPERLRNTLEVPWPLPSGWCAGAYRGRVVSPGFVWQTSYPCRTRVEWQAVIDQIKRRVPEGQCGRPSTLIGTFHFEVDASAPSRAPHPACAPPHSTTVVKNATTRVFTQPFGPYRFTFGCLLAARGAVVLAGADEFGGSDSAELVRLAGPYVAYGFGYTGPNETYEVVRVVDLRAGDIVHSVGPGPAGIDFQAALYALVLKDNGAVAWIGWGGVEDETGKWLGNATVVGKFDSGGYSELDRGDGIEPGSLHLDGSTLRWVRDGVVGSAPLD